MKLAVSDIAWDRSRDEWMYGYLAEQGITGLEAAPTCLFPDSPYGKLTEAAALRHRLWSSYRLQVVSLQSIWYGRQEHLFGTSEERQSLLEYTKRAIDFAAALECPNLVFGSPKNRVRGDASRELALDFFGEAGEYARQHGIVLALEANPAIYGTDFINHTAEAFSLAAEVGSAGIAVNLDLGTMTENAEETAVLPADGIGIHHVHLSEPYLAVPVSRPLHKAVAAFLRQVDYAGYVSLEMKRPAKEAELLAALSYLSEVFGK